MTQVEVLGRIEHLDGVLTTLQHHQVAEVVDTRPTDDVLIGSEAANPELELVEAVLRHAPPPTDRQAARWPSADQEGAALRTARGLRDQLEALEQTEQALTVEGDILGHQVSVLDGLQALVPELAELSDAELDVLGLATVALVLDDAAGAVVAALREQLAETHAGRHLLVSTEGLGGGIAEGEGIVGCLLVVPRADLDAVERLLGADRIARVSVPDAYAGRSLVGTIAAMRARLARLPEEREAVTARRDELLAPHLDALQAARVSLLARAERGRAAQAAVLTDRTFVLRIWLARRRRAELTDLLARPPGRRPRRALG